MACTPPGPKFLDLPNAASTPKLGDLTLRDYLPREDNTSELTSVLSDRTVPNDIPLAAS